MNIPETMYLGRFETYGTGFRYNGTIYKTLEEAVRQFFEDNPYIRSPGNYWPFANPMSPADFLIYNIIEHDVFYRKGKCYWYARRDKNGKVEIKYSKSVPRFLTKPCPECDSLFDKGKIQEQLDQDVRLHPVVRVELKRYTFDEFEELFKHDEPKRKFFSMKFSSCSAPQFFLEYDKKLSFGYTSRPAMVHEVTVASLKSTTRSLFRIYMDLVNGFEQSYLTLPEIYKYIEPAYVTFFQDNGRIHEVMYK